MFVCMCGWIHKTKSSFHNRFYVLYSLFHIEHVKLKKLGIVDCLTQIFSSKRSLQCFIAIKHEKSSPFCYKSNSYRRKQQLLHRNLMSTNKSFWTKWLKFEVVLFVTLLTGSNLLYKDRFEKMKSFFIKFKKKKRNFFQS